jgi:membrane protease YdiL (CAAX protease family)
VRRHFHLCLAGGLLPVVNVPFVWALAVFNLRVRNQTAEHRLWARRLLGLAIADTVIAALVLTLIAMGVWSWRTILTEPPKASADASASVRAERAVAAVDPAPAKPRSCRASFHISLNVLLRWRGLWVALTLIAVLWAIARQRGAHRPALWSWVLVAFGVAAVAATLTAWGGCVVAGGRRPETALLAAVVHSLTLLAVGIVVMRRMAWRGLLEARIGPRLDVRRAVIRGLFYLMAGGIRLGIVVAAIQSLFQLDVPSSTAEGVATSLATLTPLGKFLLATRVVLIVPAAEEVLFRGIVLPRLARWMGAASAVFATAAVFAVLHEGGQDPVGVREAIIFIIALVLGWARLRTGGLAAPIVVHSITNAMALWFSR